MIDDLLLEALSAKVRQHRVKYNSYSKRSEKYPTGSKERRNMIASAMLHRELLAQYEERIQQLRRESDASQKA